MAAAETDPQWKADLLTIAENCAVVPAHKPQTFHQALQMYWFVHLAVTSELNPWDSYSPGRLDQHVYPFYRDDVAAGRLTRDQALELLECLWVKFNNQPAPPKVGVTLKESGTYTDFANINTGGIAPDGSDGVNDVSYLILDCMDDMKLLQPSSNVQISRKTPMKFLLRACEISRKGWGQPAFYNTEAIVQELLAAGKSLEDARRGGTSGCVETARSATRPISSPATSTSRKSWSSRSTTAMITSRAASSACRSAMRRISIPMRSCSTPITSRSSIFWTSRSGAAPHREHLRELHARAVPLRHHERLHRHRKGLQRGGARYNTSYLQGVGIGTVTDSLAAIRFQVLTGRTSRCGICSARCARTLRTTRRS